MKTIEIGNEKYRLIETAEDLSIERYKQLKEYFIYKETGVDSASLISTLQGFMQAFDRESKSGMVVTLHNYLVGLDMAKNKEDADQMVFALIVLEKDEDAKNITPGEMKEKLERMNANGLTQGFVEETVTNFTKASSTSFVTYFRENLMGLEQMSEQLDS